MGTATSPEDAFRVPKDIAYIGNEHRVVVLNLETTPEPTPIALEGTGPHIWEAIQELSQQETHTEHTPAQQPRITIDKLTRRLAEDFGIEPENIRHDIQTFVATAIKQGILEAA